MSNGESKKLTKEEVQAILEENQRLKAQLETRKASGGGRSAAASYARMKERMASDPTFAAAVKAKRARYQESMRKKIAANPALAEAKKAKQKAYREAKAAELAEFRKWKQEQK